MVSFQPTLAKATIGVLYLKTLKKLYGARLARPSASRVAIQPIGRGPRIEAIGSCFRPWPWAGSQLLKSSCMSAVPREMNAPRRRRPAIHATGLGLDSE